MRRINQYEGLYGDRGHLPGSEYLFSELLETRSRHYDWDIKPHVHPSLYQLFFVEQGRFEFLEASESRKLQGPCLMLIPPAALHGFIYDSGVTGRILTMSDTLVDTLFSGLELLTPMLRNIVCISSFTDPYSPVWMQTSIAEIDHELFSNRAEKQLMLRACLQQLLLAVYRLWQHKDAAVTEPDNASLNYFRKFRSRIRQISATDTITKLAAELGITAVHLNRICNKIAGKPAGQLIQEHLLQEAQKYLTYTSYSVSEIAYLLSFEYPNYFARFFKKHTGLSPREFREGKK